MDKSIPLPAVKILDMIGNKEAPRGYDTVYGNNQRQLTKPITEMTLDELILNQAGFTKNFGSSASGRYQFMRATLQDLKKELKMSGREKFTPDLQDRLGYHLLKRRGYVKWVNGDINHDSFMIGIAKEWASFPVPYNMKGAHRNVKRGESYYAGDRLNMSLIGPDVVWLGLQSAYALRDTETQIADENEDIPSIVVTDEMKEKMKADKGFMAALAALINAFMGKKEA